MLQLLQETLFDNPGVPAASYFSLSAVLVHGVHDVLQMDHL